MDIVWNILLILLAALGLTEVIRILVLKVTTTGRSSRMVVIIPVSGHHDDIEYVLRSAAQRLKWMDGQEDAQIYCLDYGMDSETLHICRLVSSEYGFMKIVQPEQLDTCMGQDSLQIVK